MRTLCDQVKLWAGKSAVWPAVPARRVGALLAALRQLRDARPERAGCLLFVIDALSLGLQFSDVAPVCQRD